MKFFNVWILLGWFSLLIIINMLFLSCGSIDENQNPEIVNQSITAPQRIAILELKDYTQAKISETERKYLSNLIRQAVGLLPKNQYLVMTQENIISLLPETKVLEDCLKDCEVLIGRELGAHFIITGDIVQFGQALRVSLKLHESKSGILRGSDAISGVKVEELENLIKGATLGLFQEFVPKIKAQVNHLKKNFVKEKVVFALPFDLVDLSKVKLSKLSNPIELPDHQIIFHQNFNSKTVRLGNIQPRVIELFNQVISHDKDFNLSAKQKLMFWEKLDQEISSSELSQLIKQRIKNLEQVVLAEQYFFVAQSDHNRSHPNEKIKLWQSLLQIDIFKKQAEIRIKEWQDFLKANPLPDYHFEQIYQILMGLLEKRSTQIKSDWEKLSRLLKLASVPKSDKILWINSFLESYGFHSLFNPYFKEMSDMPIVRSMSDQKWRKMQATDLSDREKIIELLKIFPFDFWQTHANTLQDALMPTDLFDPEYHQIRPVVLESLFPKKIKLNQIDFIRIEGGTYVMGKNEKHDFNIKPFYISMTEITTEDYWDCVDAGVCTPLPTDHGCHWKKMEKRNHPINCIAWQEARTFARWLGGDLPSEAQWEYAARSQGQNIVNPCSLPNGHTRQGVCDMMGNVSEWVINQKIDESLDLQSSTQGIRGSSFDPSKNRSTYHLTSKTSRSIDINTRAVDIGFRMVLPITPSF